MQETDAPVSLINAEVGIANVTHVNRVFRARTDLAPSQYRVAR